jgi:hypothetical protein
MTTISVDHWDRNAEGTQVVCVPLTGWETAPMKNGMAGLIRLEYLTDPSSKKKSALQLAIPTDAVASLIGELQILEKQLRTNFAADVPTGKPS